VGFPVAQALIYDDAPQFNGLTQQMMQCWVHEGRHYKKLSPLVALNRARLTDFLQHFWDYYDQLLAYRQTPSPEEHQRLESGFDQLFARKTDYQALDQRISQTQAKKESLLLVLKYPELPLHNNAAELWGCASVSTNGMSVLVREHKAEHGPGIRLLPWRKLPRN
jgi:hypothetical protein